jgi:hypothetical protein
MSVSGVRIHARAQRHCAVQLEASASETFGVRVARASNHKLNHNPNSLIKQQAIFAADNFSFVKVLARAQ